MNLVNSVMVFVSGALVFASVVMTKVAYSKAVLSRKAAAIMAGIGAGVGCGILTYYGISNGDFTESIFTGFIVMFPAAFVSYITNKTHKPNIGQ